MSEHRTRGHRALQPAGILMRLASGLLVGALCWAASQPARAEADPPGRVGRVVELQGNVSRYDQDEGRWADAERNRPLTTGDRLSTSGGGRVELRVGSTVVRLGGNSELEFARLDDERIVLQLHSGALALRVRSREVAAEIEVLTAEARLRPQRGGHFRFDRIDDTTYAGSWRGDLSVEESPGWVITTGQRLELYRDATGLRQAVATMPNDAFGSWVIAQEQREERTASARYVSPEMTGAEDLDRYGAWERHPEYGTIWYPYTVSVGWAPYRYGRWVWVRPWGWTWVDDYPWGFAPFHYGRWVHYRGRWCWVPGTYVARPIYAPAMVAWVGGSHWGVSVNVGGPTVGWVPLAPREVFIPYYRSTPIYVDRVNVSPRSPVHIPQQQPVPPSHYRNQTVSGGVTVVPHDVLVRRAPVAQAVVSVSEPHRAQGTGAPPAPNVVAQPPAHSARVPPPWREAASPGQQPGRAVNEPRPANGQQPQPLPPARQEQPVPPARQEQPAPQPAAPPSQRREGGGPGNSGAQPPSHTDREWQPRGRNAPAVVPAQPQPPPQQAGPMQPQPQPQPRATPAPRPVAQPTPQAPPQQQAQPRAPQHGAAVQPAPRAQPAAPARNEGDDRKRPPRQERDRPGETSK